MTIRRRLAISFFVIVLLFGINIAVYFNGNAKRTDSFEELSTAFNRLSLAFDVEGQIVAEQQRVSNLIALGNLKVTDQPPSETEAGLEPEVVQSQLEKLEAEKDAFKNLLDDIRKVDSDKAAGLGQAYGRTAQAWEAFFRSLEISGEEEEGGGEDGVGVPVPASGEEAGAEEADEGAAPLDEENKEIVALEQLAKDLLDRLVEYKDEEVLRVQEARKGFEEVSATTNKSILTIFILSALTALVVAIAFSAYLDRGLRALKLGARRVGSGDLEHRIALEGEDELTELAGTFNEMSQSLLVARSKLEEARAVAEDANRAKSTFLANMSHELRTPMNAIIGYSEMLLEEAEDLEQEDFVPDLERILAASKHLLALINDILDLSKIEAGKMTLFLEDFPVADLVDDVTATIGPLVSKNANRLEVEVASDTGTLRADETKLRQTLFNLLSNACKFTSKGTITLTARRQVTAGGDRMRFTVSDTGIGMSRQQMDRIFEEFTQADSSTTRKFGGTGLGLTISKRFCQLMGGDIAVESTEGVGTTFTVDLPALVREPGEEAEAPPPEDGSAGAPLPKRQEVPTDTVLVIDDDTATLDLTRRTLAREGFHVVTAESGSEGLELARELRPKSITLDVMMPGLDGFAVLSSLKEDPDTREIPVVMMSMLDERERGLTLGANEYLAKPVDRQRLASVLRRVQEVPETGGRVLVVDDEAAVRGLLRRALEADGWEIREAENGLVALAQLADLRPDLILLDLVMPQMDGFDFLDHVRAEGEWEGVPVVVLTGKDLGPEDQARLNDQVEAILFKDEGQRSDHLLELRRLVRSTVERSGGDDG